METHCTNRLHLNFFVFTWSRRELNERTHLDISTTEQGLLLD